MTGSRKNILLGLRAQVYSVVSSASGSRASRIFNSSISVLILLSVAIIMVNTCDIPTELLLVNIVIQIVLSVIFTLEYLLRLWSSDFERPELKAGKARLRFVVSIPSIVDLLAILPFWLFILTPFDLRFLGIFRVFRVMRLLRLSFYSKAIAVVGTVLKSCARQLVSALLLLILLLLVASILLYNAEHAAQPEVFDNAFSGFWWAVQTITTIGYGDIYPITVLGKVFGVIIALLGIGVIAIPTGIISASFVAYGKRGQTQEEES